MKNFKAFCYVPAVVCSSIKDLGIVASVIRSVGNKFPLKLFGLPNTYLNKIEVEVSGKAAI